MPNILRTATPNGDWRSFKFTCEETAGLLGANNAWADGSSWLYQINDSIGALFQDVAFGDEGVLYYHAEKILVPKGTGSGEGFLPGMAVYFGPVTRFVYNAMGESDFILIGTCTEPAGDDDTLVEIDLDGGAAAAR